MAQRRGLAPCADAHGCQPKPRADKSTVEPVDHRKLCLLASPQILYTLRKIKNQVNNKKVIDLVFGAEKRI